MLGGREEVLKQETEVKVKEELEQKSFFGVGQGHKGEGMGGSLCFILPSM